MLGRKFDWAEERSAQAVRALGDAATIVEPRQRSLRRSRAATPTIASWSALWTVSADYLVTGDRRHLLPLEEYQGARILNAPRFLSFLGER